MIDHVRFRLANRVGETSRGANIAWVQGHERARTPPGWARGSPGPNRALHVVVGSEQGLGQVAARKPTDPRDEGPV